MAPASFFGTGISRRALSLVWCNPQFDTELGGGQRVEHTFLERSTHLLVAGGIIALVCPERVAGRGDIRELLLTWYTDIRVVTFPAEHRPFDEVIVFGVKREKQVPAAEQSWKALKRGKRVVRAIGFEAGEQRRRYAHVVQAIGLDASEEHRLTWARSTATRPKRQSREAWLDQNFFVYYYPLMEWGYDRERRKQVIAAAGLPVPEKSACFYCPANKKREIMWLEEHHPELLQRALAMESNAMPKLRSVKGLGRSFSWADYLAQANDLPLLRCCNG